MFTCVRTRHPLPHKSSVIRFRHPHGVFTCVRVLHPSNMLNIEFLFCLLCFFIIAFTVNCLSALNVDVMCINHVYHCAGMTNQYTNCELCCNSRFWCHIYSLLRFFEFKMNLLRCCFHF